MQWGKKRRLQRLARRGRRDGALGVDRRQTPTNGQVAVSPWRELELGRLGSERETDEKKDGKFLRGCPDSSLPDGSIKQGKK